MDSDIEFVTPETKTKPTIVYDTDTLEKPLIPPTFHPEKGKKMYDTDLKKRDPRATMGIQDKRGDDTWLSMSIGLQLWTTTKIWAHGLKIIKANSVMDLTELYMQCSYKHWGRPVIPYIGFKAIYKSKGSEALLKYQDLCKEAIAGKDELSHVELNQKKYLDLQEKVALIPLDFNLGVEIALRDGFDEVVLSNKFKALEAVDQQFCFDACVNMCFHGWSKKDFGSTASGFEIKDTFELLGVKSQLTDDLSALTPKRLLRLLGPSIVLYFSETKQTGFLARKYGTVEEASDGYHLIPAAEYWITDSKMAVSLLDAYHRMDVNTGGTFYPSALLILVKRGIDVGDHQSNLESARKLVQASKGTQ
jgi:hypothetical protein